MYFAGSYVNDNVYVQIMGGKRLKLMKKQQQR
jgi:hypothetical protein